MVFRSDFARRFSRPAGIVDLMRDLGEALNQNPELLFLGGGNPAHIPGVESELASALHRISADATALRSLLGIYQSPQGSERLLAQLSQYFRKRGWPVTAANLCITNGSQAAFFALSNLLAGSFSGAPEHILLPMLPEYLGYVDQGVHGTLFKGCQPQIKLRPEGRFKYHVDFELLSIDEATRALLVSCPGNPSGNVLTNEEIVHLGQLADTHNIPLIIDCAYGAPFPSLIYTKEHELRWASNRIFVLSLSKLGLPGARTGIVVADEAVIEALVSTNTVFNLASGNLGPALLSELLATEKLDGLVNTIIRPFYCARREQAVAIVEHYLSPLGVRLHEPDGAFFLWLWLPELPITSGELYQTLKEKKVLVLDGSHAFFGAGRQWRHAHECIRLNYCADMAVFEKAVVIIAEQLSQWLRVRT